MNGSGKTAYGSGTTSEAIEPGTQILHARLLGSFGLTWNGQVIDPVPHLARRMMQYAFHLRLQGRSRVPASDLEALLWPNIKRPASYGRLSVAVRLLREWLEARCRGAWELVELRDSELVLEPSATLLVDAWEMQRHWQTALLLRKAGRVHAAVEEYESATTLYAGAYLDEEPNADWTLLTREALRNIYADALTGLAMLYEGRGEHEAACKWARELVALDPCREDAYRLLISATVRLGQRAEAACWYRRCAAVLRDELNVEPSPSTRQVYREAAEGSGALPCGLGCDEPG